jgi:hypothetical protein
VNAPTVRAKGYPCSIRRREAEWTVKAHVAARWCGGSADVLGVAGPHHVGECVSVLFSVTYCRWATGPPQHVFLNSEGWSEKGGPIVLHTGNSAGLRVHRSRAAAFAPSALIPHSSQDTDSTTCTCTTLSPGPGWIPPSAAPRLRPDGVTASRRRGTSSESTCLGALGMTVTRVGPMTECGCRASVVRAGIGGTLGSCRPPS